MHKHSTSTAAYWAAVVKGAEELLALYVEVGPENMDLHDEAIEAAARSSWTHQTDLRCGAAITMASTNHPDAYFDITGKAPSVSTWSDMVSTLARYSMTEDLFDAAEELISRHEAAA